jgi:hypothetical protein
LRRKRTLPTIIGSIRSACGSVSRSSRRSVCCSVCLTPRMEIGTFQGLAPNLSRI